VVALLIYACSRGNRSSRGIERECREDVVYKLITALRVPDHSTIAEFRRRHETALGAVFSQVLGLCREAGLAKVGVIAVDGTKVAANASKERNVEYQRVVREILAEAERIDADEDEQFGEERGDELPEELQTPAGRERALREAKQRLEREQPGDEEQPEPRLPDGQRADSSDAEGAELMPVFDRETVERASGRGRRRWFVEGHKQLVEHRRQQAKPVPRSRAARLLEVEQRFTEQLAVELAANQAYEAYIAVGVTPAGKRFRAKPSAYVAPVEPEGKMHTTDPDSRVMQTTTKGWIQGYNAQAAVNENHIVIAAEITVESPDFGHLEEIVTATERELELAGVTAKPEVIVADAGYWHQEQIEKITGRGIRVIIPPDANTRDGERPGWNGGLYAFMRNVIKSERGGECYRKRQALIEPVFGDVKFNRKIDRFQRRGRAAVLSEWRLITATHNLIKLHNHWLATDTG
jgi:hypothetical protein